MKLTLREIDALVAEKVMGFKPCSDPLGKCDEAKMVPPKCWGDGGAGSELRRYSQDIDAAWDVVEKFSSFFLGFDEATETWGASLDFSRRVKEDCKGVGAGETAPLAICLAALKAFGESIEVIE